MTQPIVSGPHSSVRNTIEPFDDVGEQLIDAQNGYFRDPQGKSGFLARPGFSLQNPSGQLGAGAGSAFNNCVHGHIAGGSVLNFFVANQKIYRTDTAMTTFTDVTPAGVTLGTSLGLGSVYMTSLGADTIIVNDGAERPWVMSSLNSTPCVATFIDIDGAGGFWTAMGPPVIYQDSVFFIVFGAPGGSPVSPENGIVWSEPGQPTVGYTQSGFADFWNLIETNAEPVWALVGTNVGLFYFRSTSIGVLQGTPSINFQTTATRDSRSTEVGTVSAGAVKAYKNYLYFVDRFGRPWRLNMYSGDPEPLWLQLPAVVTANSPNVISARLLTDYAKAEIIPELNLYVVAIWASSVSNPSAPTIMYAFNADMGTYCGSWQLNPAISVLSIGQVSQSQIGTSTYKTVAILGSLVAGGTATDVGGYVWLLHITGDNVWTDNGAAPVVFAKTGRMGYAADQVMMADTATLLVLSQATMSVKVETPISLSTTEVTTLPVSGAQDNVFRAVMGMDVVAARGMQVTVSPNSATAQWGFQQITAQVAFSKAGPEDT